VLEPVNSISILIPIYDEQKNIEILYGKLIQWMESETRKTEVIFINDASKDGSSQVLNKLASKDQRIKIIHFGRNQG
jgi:dolichol-phosphate mannosyltransferase